VIAVRASLVVEGHVNVARLQEPARRRAQFLRDRRRSGLPRPKPAFARPTLCSGNRRTSDHTSPQVRSGEYDDTAGIGVWLSCLANGETKPIADVQVGDQVLAADPETRETGAREVVPVTNGRVGALSSTGEATEWINVYRTNTGFVHGSPGSPG
jgi:hypothetical protein